MTGLLTVSGVLTNPGPAMASALNSPATATAVAGRRSIVVTWTAPAGNPTVGHYTATAGTEHCDAASPFSGGLTCTINNLTAGTAYTVGVVACPSTDVNVTTDCSSATNAASVKPGPPGTPAAPAAVFHGNPETVTLSWTAPDPGAGIDSYRIAATPSTGLTGTCGSLVAGPTTTCDFGGLTDDTSYTFKVTAIGVTTTAGTTGTSSASLASAAKVAGPPHTPAAPTVTRFSDTAVTVDWSKPGGSQALSGYTVHATSSNGGAPATCTAAPAATECLVTGLGATNSYTFTVTAVGELPGGGASSPGPASSRSLPVCRECRARRPWNSAPRPARSPCPGFRPPTGAR